MSFQLSIFFSTQRPPRDGLILSTIKASTVGMDICSVLRRHETIIAVQGDVDSDLRNEMQAPMLSLSCGRMGANVP